MGPPNVKNCPKLWFLATGMAKAVAVSEVLEDSNLVKHVKFISFDTTASNTERNTGACVMLQQKLQLLSLPDVTFTNLLWIRQKNTIHTLRLSQISNQFFFIN